MNASTGFVGVGTSAPTQLLDVRGNINVSNTIYVRNGTDVALFAYNHTAAVQGTNIFDQQLNTTSNVQFANITSTGNVTATSLTVPNFLYANATGVGIGTNAIAGANNIGFIVQRVGGTGTSFAQFRTSATGDFASFVLSNGLTMDFRDSLGVSRIALVTNGTSYINPLNGNVTFAPVVGHVLINPVTITMGVGIGVTSGNPTQKLDVRGNGNFSGTIWINNGTDVSTIANSVSKWATNGTAIYNDLVLELVILHLF